MAVAESAPASATWRVRKARSDGYGSIHSASELPRSVTASVEGEREERSESRAEFRRAFAGKRA